MQQQGDLVGATVVDSDAGLQLLHPKIAIPTYPWEWTAAQWLAAAELTLTLCERAVGEGWILKDATPLNIVFDGPRPVMVDILSFERRDPFSPIWLAYGQFIRTFVLPLMMNRLLSWPLTLSFFKRDGYEPAELYRALGWRQRLSPAALWLISLPTWLERRQGPEASAHEPRRMTDTGAALHVIQRMLANLRRQTRRAMPSKNDSKWSEYPDTLTHYTREQSEQKRGWVRQALEEFRPERVLDIGANTGEYSALAAKTGAKVTALERDAASAEQIYDMSCEQVMSIQTIHADLARPTPAAGWGNAESPDLLSRLEGKFELVMMLAVIHHLILMEQIPLPAILTLCHRLTRRHLIVEWVPAEDPMYRNLMRGRESLYGALTSEDLLAACAEHFRTVRQQALGNGRILFLFEKL